MKKLFLASIVIVTMIVLSGCGGGGGGTTPITVALDCEGSRSGMVYPSGSFSNYTQVTIGDYTGNYGNRGIISFPISSIPAGATIQTATLRAYQANLSPQNGYDLGPVKVDHITFTMFDSGLYNQAALSTISGFLATSFSEGWKEIGVSSAVQNDLNNSRARSQFRFYHEQETNNDNIQTADYWYIAHATLKPQLIVTYTK